MCFIINSAEHYVIDIIDCVITYDIYYIFGVEVSFCDCLRIRWNRHFGITLEIREQIACRITILTLGFSTGNPSDLLKLDCSQSIKCVIDSSGSLKFNRTFALLKSICSPSLFEATFSFEGDLGSSEVEDIDEFIFTPSFVNVLMLELMFPCNGIDEAGLGLLLDTVSVALKTESGWFGSS